MTFWERLQKASEWGGVSCAHSDVAKELGVGLPSITKYVDGGYPKKDRINALAKKRGVRSEWLLSGLGDMVAEEALDEDTLELLKLFRLLPDDAKQRLLISARHETNAATALITGKRQILTEELIRLLEVQQRRDQ